MNQQTQALHSDQRRE